jgi:putative ABC transport system permease protein
VAAQVALTLMLLVGAGLMIRSFTALMDVDPGFRADRVLTAVVNSGGSSIGAGEAQINFYRDLLQRISSSPGVVSAAAINHLPLAGDVWGTSFVLQDRPEPAPGERFTAVYRVVSPGYFSTMGAVVTRGRDFADTDRAHGEPVALINEAMARRFWPGQDPVGKRLRMGRNEGWSTVIGLVRDVKQREWAGTPDPEIYISYLQHPDHFSSPWSSSMTLVVRTAEDPASFVKTLQAAASSTHRNIPVSDIATLDQVVTDSVRQPRVFAMLLGIFACAALLLAAIGIYGVISYTVSQRMHDMGIRVALGAAPGDLLRHVLGQGGRMIAAGLAMGILGSLVLSRAMSALLFGVQPNDVPTYAAVSAVLIVIGLAASYVPARRAAGVDPVTALRQM